MCFRCQKIHANPTVAKVVLVAVSVIFLLSQIAAFIYGCIEDEVVVICPALVGIVTGCFCIWAGLQRMLWAVILAICLGITLFIWYTVLWTIVYSQTPNNTMSLTSMERKFKCCGKTGPSYYRNQNLVVPQTCYPADKVGDQKYLYVKGCDEVPKLQALSALEVVKIIAIVIVSIILAFFLAIIFCMFLTCVMPCCIACCCIQLVRDGEGSSSR